MNEKHWMNASSYNQAMSGTSPLKAILLGMVCLTLSVIASIQPDNGASVLTENYPEGQNGENSIKKLESLLIWYPNSTEIHERIGILYDQSASYDAAIIHLLSGYQAHRLSSTGLFALGDSYYHTGLSNQALKIWGEIAPGNDDAVTDKNKIVSIYLVDGHIQEAAQIMRAWYKQTNEVADGLNAAGLLLENDPIQALVILRALNTDSSRVILPLAEKIQLQPDYAKIDDVWLQLVLEFRKANAYVAAEAAIKHLQSLKQDQNPYIWMEYALIKGATGRDGSVELKRGLALGIEDAAINMKAAEYWLSQKQADRALIYLEQAKLLQPDDAMVLRPLGEVQLSAGLTNDGLNNLLKAAELLKDDTELWLRIARYTIEHHDQMETIGVKAARQAVIQNPSDPAGYDLLGQIYLVEGDLINAEKMLQKALTYAPHDVDINIHNSMMLIAKGSGSEAKLTLEILMKQTLTSNQKQQIQSLIKSIN